MDTLWALTGSDVMLTDPAEDIRGHTVRDSAGEKIGRVDELLVDHREKRARLLCMGAGGLPGLGGIQVLIPVDAIVRITDSEVHVNRTRGHVAGAPRYDPDVVDQRYLESVYAYYGYYPYWAPGYVYPSYPAYPNT